MILLTSAADAIRVVTAQDALVDVHASWVDNASSGITPDRANIGIAAAATTVIVPAPVNGAQRNVKYMTARNKDASQSCVITFEHVSPAGTVQLHQETVLPEGQIQFTDGHGFSGTGYAREEIYAEVSGVPVNGQYAQWVDGKSIIGVDAPVGVEGPPGPVGPEGPIGPAGASSSSFFYRVDAQSQAASDPGAGRIRYNATPMSNATMLYVDALTQDSFDPTAMFTAATVDDELIIQDKTDATIYQHWTMTGPGVNQSGWFEVPVAFVAVSGPQANFSNNQDVAVLLKSRGQPGPAGPVGPIGPAGPQGVKGDTGMTGPTGPQGPQGIPGPQGATGSAGADSTVPGPQGPQGIPGTPGATGAQGPQGVKGDTGATGPKGDTGATGPQGPVGVATANAPLALTGTTLSIDLSAYAPLASPVLTGNPTAPTPTAGDNDTSIATTAFVVTKAANYLPLAGGTLTGNLTISSAGAGSTIAINNSSYTNVAFNNAAGAGVWAVGKDAIGRFVVTASGIADWLVATASTGNVQILSTTASTSPTTGALTVAGGVGIVNNLYIGTSTAAPGNYVVNISYSGNTVYGIALRQAVDGGGQAISFVNAAGTIVGSITNTVSVTAYNTTSDGRLKQDFREFDAGVIIDAIGVYDFAWKIGGRAYGVVAQEAAEVYPLAVTHDAKHDVWFTDYSKFVPLLLQELKDLRARVAMLEAKGGG